MAGITLQHAEEQLAIWIAAAEQVAKRQTSSFQGRTLTLANAGEIQNMIEFWDKQCKRLERGGPRVSGVVAL